MGNSRERGDGRRWIAVWPRAELASAFLMFPDRRFNQEVQLHGLVGNLVAASFWRSYGVNNLQACYVPAQGKTRCVDG